MTGFIQPPGAGPGLQSRMAPMFLSPGSSLKPGSPVRAKPATAAPRVQAQLASWRAARATG